MTNREFLHSISDIELAQILVEGTIETMATEGGLITIESDEQLIKLIALWLNQDIERINKNGKEEI